MAYRIQLSSDGGSNYLDPAVALADAEALAYVSSGTYSIKAKLETTVGVESYTWTITSADDEHVSSLPSVTTNPDKSCSFEVPKTGGAWLLQCKVNGGVDQRTGDTDPSLTPSIAIKVRTSNGQQLIAVGETTEAGSSGYTEAWNDLARVAAASSGQTGTATFSCAAGGSLTIDGTTAGACRIELTGSPASDVTLSFPTGASYRGRTWVVSNGTSDATKIVKVNDGGSGIWLPPGASRTVSLSSSDTITVADGKGDVWDFQASIAGPSGTGSFITNLFKLPAGWAIEGILEYLQTPAGGGVTATSTVGLTVGPVNLLNNAAPVVKPSIRGYTSADWAASFTNGYYLSDTDKQIGQAFTVSAGSLVGAVLVVTLRGRRVVT